MQTRSDPGRTDADEHLHEAGAGDREKGIEAWPATARDSSVLPVPGAEVAVPC